MSDGQMDTEARKKTQVHRKEMIKIGQLIPVVPNSGACYVFAWKNSIIAENEVSLQ